MPSEARDDARSSAQPKGERLGYGLVGLLGLCGLALLALAARQHARGLEQEALILLAFGGLLVFGALLGRGHVARALREQAARAARRAEQPDAPWSWRSEWIDAQGIAAGRAGQPAALPLAVLLLAVSAPIATQFEHELARGNRAVWIALVFPAVGLGFLAQGLLELWRRRKFGLARLRAAELPFALGASTRARLVVPLGCEPSADGHWSLLCTRTTCRGRYSQRERSEQIVWTDSRPIAVDAWQRSEAGSELELELELPAEPASTPEENEMPRIRWVLELEVPARGADLALRFELPVFEAPQPARQMPRDASAQRAADEAQRLARARAARERALAAAGLELTPAPDGAAELVLPPRRAWRIALAPALFALVLGGLGALLDWAGLPFVFSLGLWFTGALLAWIAFELVRDASGRVRVQGRELVVQRGGEAERRVPREEIARVKLSGSVGAGTQRFHDIAIECSAGTTGLGGRRLCVARRVNGDAAAQAVVEWLEQELRRAA